MGTYGVAASAAITLGRIGYGYVALFEPRYATVTNWVFIAIVMLAATLRDGEPRPNSVRFWRTACAALVLLSAVSLPRHVAAIHHSYAERLRAQAVFMFAEAAQTGWPNVPQWADWGYLRGVLVSLEGTGWRQHRPKVPTWMGTYACQHGVVERTAAPEDPSAVGWAFLPARGRIADAVLVTSGSTRQVVRLATPSIGRPDVVATLARTEAHGSGWLMDMRSVTAEEPVEFWALDVEARRAYPLCNPAR
jgi:hypothetical protein